MKTRHIVKPVVAAGALLAGQLARAILREDLPSLENQDPSGIFGNQDSPPLRIVFLGDSSVTAPGVDPLDDSWPRQIALHLSTRFHVDAISVAVGGSKARDVLDTQMNQAITLNPDIAYVSVGSNDALRGTPIPRFETEYGQIVAGLHGSIPAVGLSGIGELGTIPRLPELARGVARVRSRAIDKAITRVAEGYPRTVKSNAWNVMYPAFEQYPEMFGPDLFHASAEGHLMFASAAKPVSDKLVEIWRSHNQDASS